MRGPSVGYRDRVMVTCQIPNSDAVVTGTIVFRWGGPPPNRAMYTVVLDAPLVDGRCMVDTSPHHLLVLAAT